MKTFKTILLIFSLLVSFVPIKAQLINEVGVKAGINVSDFRIPNLRSLYYNSPGGALDESVVNPLAVFFLRNTSLQSLPVELELIYTRMGGGKTFSMAYSTNENPEPSSYVDLTTEIGFHYLIVGLSLEPSLSLGSVDIYGRLGSTVSYLLAVTTVPFFEDRFSRYLLGYQIGAGMSFEKLFEQPVILELTYAANFKYAYRSGTGDYFNRSWFVSVGISL